MPYSLCDVVKSVKQETWARRICLRLLLLLQEIQCFRTLVQLAFIFHSQYITVHLKLVFWSRLSYRQPPKSVCLALHWYTRCHTPAIVILHEGYRKSTALTSQNIFFFYLPKIVLQSHESLNSRIKSDGGTIPKWWMSSCINWNR